MVFKKMTFDGVTYNVLTDEELEEVKHQAYLDYVTEKTLQDLENNSVSYETFVKEKKSKYGI